MAHLRLGALAKCQSRQLTPLIDHDLQLGSLYLASAQQGILRETPFKNIEYGKPNTVVGQPGLAKPLPFFAQRRSPRPLPVRC
jgi:hypothetical protein